MLAQASKLALRSPLLIRSFAASTMSAQSGIIPEGDTSAYFGTYKVNYSYLATEQGRKTFVDAAKGFNDLLAQKTKDHQIPVTGCISFSLRLWQTLTKDIPALKGTAPELKDFPGYGKAPSTQEDLYIHIHSKKTDATLEAAKDAVDSFGPLRSLIICSDEQNGFVYRDSRDLIGFVDGSANPHGDEKRIAAALGEDGSSYVHVQRFIHNLSKWNTVEVSEQEQIVGRTKPDSKELKPSPFRSHVQRTDLKENGKGLKIVRQSLPYLNAGRERGLWFTAYCRTIYNHEAIQKSLYGLADGHTDRLMDYITPVTGGYYYAPSLDQLAKL